MINLYPTKNEKLIKAIVTDPILFSQVDHSDVIHPNKYKPYLGDIWLLAKEDKEILGLVKFKKYTAITYEGHIYILPKYQATGKSVEIAQKALECIKQRYGIMSVIVPVPRECQYVTKFVTKLGFVGCGIIKNGIIYKNKLQDVLLYQKELKEVLNG